MSFDQRICLQLSRTASAHQVVTDHPDTLPHPHDAWNLHTRDIIELVEVKVNLSVVRSETICLFRSSSRRTHLDSVFKLSPSIHVSLSLREFSTCAQYVKSVVIKMSRRIIHFTPGHDHRVNLIRHSHIFKITIYVFVMSILKNDILLTNAWHVRKMSYAQRIWEISSRLRSFETNPIQNDLLLYVSPYSHV